MRSLNMIAPSRGMRQHSLYMHPYMTTGDIGPILDPRDGRCEKFLILLARPRGFEPLLPP